MINCDQCRKPIDPTKDDFTVIRLMLGLNNDQPSYYYFHYEDCVDDFLHLGWR